VQLVYNPGFASDGGPLQKWPNVRDVTMRPFTNWAAPADFAANVPRCAASVRRQMPTIRGLYHVAQPSHSIHLIAAGGWLPDGNQATRSHRRLPGLPAG